MLIEYKVIYFVDVFTVLSLGLLVFFTFKVEDIVLDLEGDSDTFGELGDVHFVFDGSANSCANESAGKTGKHTGFVSGHLQVLVLGWDASFEFCGVVP